MVSLQPAGYQLAQPGGMAGLGADGDDDDWLMIRGEVRTADGRAWEFTDPCLTAVEAAALAAWLQAAAGQDAGLATGPILFTEPNLAFLPGTGDGGHARIWVRFSYESLPGWLTRDTPGWQAAGYLLPLHVSRSSLAGAAQAWDHECSEFPHRM
jgi:hypothetical protein